MRKARFASKTRSRIQSDIRKGDISVGATQGWRGKFYPADLPQKCELAFASEAFNSVEINLTDTSVTILLIESDSMLAAQLFSSPLMKLIMTLLLVLAVFPAAWALEDTPANREQEAARYLQATPPKDMMSDMAEQMSKNLPQEQRESFKALLVQHLDMNALTKAIKDAMVKDFTAEELKALADFYGSPVGKSAMKKFDTYMADVMPSIQAEMMKAQAAANKSQ